MISPCASTMLSQSFRDLESTGKKPSETDCVSRSWLLPIPLEWRACSGLMEADTHHDTEVLLSIPHGRTI